MGPGEGNDLAHAHTAEQGPKCRDADSPFRPLDSLPRLQEAEPGKWIRHPESHSLRALPAPEQ